MPPNTLHAIPPSPLQYFFTIITNMAQELRPTSCVSHTDFPFATWNRRGNLTIWWGVSADVVPITTHSLAVAPDSHIVSRPEERGGALQAASGCGAPALHPRAIQPLLNECWFERAEEEDKKGVYDK